MCVTQAASMNVFVFYYFLIFSEIVYKVVICLNADIHRIFLVATERTKSVIILN